MPGGRMRRMNDGAFSARRTQVRAAATERGQPCRQLNSTTEWHKTLRGNDELPFTPSSKQ